eukprot:5749633-Prymnesium_polylepis.2
MPERAASLTTSRQPPRQRHAHLRWTWSSTGRAQNAPSATAGRRSHTPHRRRWAPCTCTRSSSLSHSTHNILVSTDRVHSAQATGLALSAQ